MTENNKKLLNDMLTQLHHAGEELNRPSNDVVSISVCNVSRESMKAMMRVFLLNHGINILTQKSIREFMDHCIAIDKEFASIDMSCIGCQQMDQKACESKYCMAYHDVDSCLKVTNKIKDLVLKKLKTKESELN